MMPHALENFYQVFPWPDQPGTPAFERRLEEAKTHMQGLIEHPWFQPLLQQPQVEILEICGGTGIGGVALGQALQHRGVHPKLLITDLRASALKTAQTWVSKMLKTPVETRVLDARGAHALHRHFDIVMMYGRATPHFSPWDLVQVLVSAGHCLKPHGIFVLDEWDRRGRIFLTTGYQRVLAEERDEKVVVSYHLGYDPMRGMIRRLFTPLHGDAPPVVSELFLWSLAELGALIWALYREMDALRFGDHSALFLARRLREGFHPGQMKLPAFLQAPSPSKHSGR